MLHLPVLKEDLVLTGDMTAELYISSDAPDTDFVVRVTDVDENGRSIKLADGLLSARYRNGFARSEFLQEGEIVCLKIRTTKLSNCLTGKGHRTPGDCHLQRQEFHLPQQQHPGRFCFRPDRGGP